MASIQKRPNGSWRARYRDGNGREPTRHFDRKVEAQRWLDEVTTSVVTGQYVDPRAGQTTLREYADLWQASLISRPATKRIVDNALRLHILPTLGARSLASLRRSDIQTLIKSLSLTLSPGSVRNVADVLNRLLRAAVDDRLLGSSPYSRIGLPPTSSADAAAPSVEDVARLSSAVPARYRALVVLLAGSGLRIGEALGLAVSDVDFLRGLVRVERQRLQDGLLGPAKTPQSNRTVPVGQVVIGALAAHLAAYPSDDALFTTDSGQPLTYGTWKKLWSSANRSTGLNIHSHALRHFAASALISGGASVKQVQTVLGHSSAAITLRVYSHLWPGDEDRTRAVMDAALSPLADCVRTEAASTT